MSDTLIFGNDCLVEIELSGIWYPIMCQSDMNYHLTQEIILKTGPNSGLVREKDTRFSESFATVTGLTPINNGITVSAFYLLQPAIRLAPQNIRLTFVDQQGVNTQISGSAIIPDITISAPVSGFAEATIEFAFTGQTTIDVITSPTGEDIFSDAWDATEGINYVDLTVPSNVLGYDNTDITEFIEVVRTGAQYDFIGNNLTPGNRQCSYNTTTHRLVFQNNFEAGETVFIVFK